MTKIFSWIFIGIVIAFFIFFFNIVALITDWWWFSEVGFTEIFTKSLATKVIVGLTVGLFAVAFLLTNFLISVRSKIPWLAAIPEALIGQPLSLNDRIVKKLGIVICLIVAFFIGLIAAASWQDVLKYFAATPFGQTDPLFGKDVAFYVFSLPIYSLGLGLARILILLSLIGCGIVYVLRGSLNLTDLLGKFNLASISQKLGVPARIATQSVAGGPPVKLIKHKSTHSTSSVQADRKARLHIGILLSLFLATVAVGTYLSLYNLLVTQSGPVFGAAFTDANIMIPILKVSVFTYGLAACMALFYGVSGKISPLIGAISLTVLVGLAQGIVPGVFQKLVVAPNELVKETPFIKHNIEATRKAYRLDRIEEREIAADKPITASDIAANNLTIKNVRLWDRAPLLSTFSQIQEIRTYYEFASVDNDRYIINGEVRQIMLSPRELASDSLPNKAWINERLTFTHGYGIAAGPVNQVTPEGLPVLFVKDLPPKSEVKELSVARPEIYYGEILNDYVITKTKSKEFDYPKGEENVYTTYTGKGGVEINSPWRRLFYAFRVGSLKMLLSGDITRESRILYNRGVIERVVKVAPFLTYDRDPYLVVAEGKLYWIIDAYTSTDRYPYSQPLPLNGSPSTPLRVNYIRSSVKAVVDAYDGTVSFYQADPDDPIIKTYAKMFPNTFRSLSDMPKSLMPHLRYPEDIFSLQTAAYTTYHMDDPQIFYNKEDLWEIPAIAQEGEQQVDGKTSIMTPRHMIMRLPGEKTEEYILMLPFTPRAKDNLSAWMVARNDGGQYGKLVVYRFPKDKLVFGPKQVISRINQDAEISQQISLWDQRGSQVIQGPLLVIPIEESLFYVRPLYLKADAGKIPELKRVIVAYENKIAMEETLEAGLARLFGIGIGQQAKSAGETVPSKAAAETSKENLLKQAVETYDAAIRAQKEGDWGRYGEEIKKLGEILNKLRP
ncbi:hypothetical protein A2627_03190 [Candidatus Woesebacteria bacterium RIFCSPHIGHO2_01_FULL_39_28]|uniref:UPF0182 protein A2627_03190 n=1 Tax=Candidatus Woesebacteria bacterium RIFCSPHIGHO2_01_FULL_39_28 TaxID=1802496 RepID=A0A1F7YEK6_9BACT|nr:MAG: hypothetical protein A2627_03190 [Candidatus Woesebacteria bacterium RIFCSPHIGHO2_01_FULL_39_28]OGM58049.1 MAG: hypothetical protein A3A50_02200 [Candidatus Woesebacteria bacterium RIFCSPLOWO2_01_FULL_38_20]